MKIKNNQSLKQTKISKMKKFLFALVPVTVLTLISLNPGNAQSINNPDPGYNENPIEINKTAAAYNQGSESISPKALRNFSKVYTGVAGQRWIKIKEGFLVRFDFNGIVNSVFYENRGNWEFSLKGYHEDKLPFEVRDAVKRKYYDYSIFYVEELENIDSHGIPTYIIHIEDKSCVKLVRVYNGQMVDIMK